LFTYYIVNANVPDLTRDSAPLAVKIQADIIRKTPCLNATGNVTLI
jgi:hypothetical protein